MSHTPPSYTTPVSDAADTAYPQTMHHFAAPLVGRATGVLSQADAPRAARLRRSPVLRGGLFREPTPTGSE